MDPGRGHKRAEFFDEFKWGKYGVRRAVAPGRFEAVGQAAIRQLFEAFSGEGRPCGVAEKPLQAQTVVAGNDNCRVEVETVGTRAQGRRSLFDGLGINPVSGQHEALAFGPLAMRFDIEAA